VAIGTRVFTKVARAHARRDRFTVAAARAAAFTETLRKKLPAALRCTQMSPFELRNSFPRRDGIHLPTGFEVIRFGSAKMKQARLHSCIDIQLKSVIVGPRKMESSGHVHNVARPVRFALITLGFVLRWIPG